MKRVLFVIPFLSSGGAERVVSIWTSGLARLGIDVHLLVFYRVEDEYIIDTKVKVHTIKNSREEYSRLSRIDKLRMLRQKLKEINPEYVLPFISYIGIIVTLCNFRLNIKVIETIRNNPRCSPNTKLLRGFRNLSVLLSKRCIVQNKEQLDYFPKFIQRKMIILSNPIGTEFIENKKEFDEAGIKNIIAVGRLEKQKNFHMLIKAFAIVKKANKSIKLKIYGEGSLYQDLNSYILKLELQDDILLCGRTKNMSKILKEADLFILSSDSEGMPNALMESMAIGLPCIATNCPTGPSDLIQSGVNGILIPVNDYENLAKEMMNVINNPIKAIEMGKNARNTIIEKYGPEFSSLKLKKQLESI